MTATQPRDVQTLTIAADTEVMRSRSWERLRFEIEYALERGTTSNSYLIQGDRSALIDFPGESFTDSFLTALTQQIDPASLDYIILGHINPNRAKTLKVLLEKAPNVTVACSSPGAKALGQLLEEDDIPKIQVVKGGEAEIDLGKGHQLRFIRVPTPRWPEGLWTYDESTRVLFSSKFFGMHLCDSAVFDLSWHDSLEDRRYYFDCLMAPNARQVSTALEKLEDFSLSMFAPVHGPVVQYHVHELLHAYQEWSQQQQGKALSVTLVYASAYGNTATIAQTLARGITKAGIAVESINAEQTDPDEIKAAIEKSAGFLIGSPTLGGHAPTPIQTALGVILSSASKNQLAGVFGSFGWSGEAIDLLESKLKDGGYSLAFDPIRVKFKPTESTLQYCEEVGTDFAQALKKVKRAKAPRTPASSVEQAVGRLVGSLCVVTTRKGDASGAMLASWVSQATFNPPGFTVAVAKERAIESLMHRDNPFVLNILADGQHQGPMRHFLKSFGPGEDRFVGIETQDAENGCPVLKDAVAYLECEVADRMECGDHWVVYATINNGELLKPDAKAAVHFRKTGTHY
ncbi:MAG: diflavin flavoprotein [Cyanobacteria bacterium P01_C01_bin.120]